MKIKVAASRLLSTVIFVFIAAFQALAQPVANAPLTTPAAATAADSNIEQNLAAILEAIKHSERELAALEKQIREEKHSGRLERLTAEIQELDRRREKLQQDFFEIASGVDPAALEDQPEERLDLTADLRELLRPLIREAQRLTERPREDERLRSEVERYSEQLALIDQAISSTKQTNKAVANPALRKYLKSAKADWEARRTQILTQLEVAKSALERRERKRKSLGQSLNDIFDLFFRSRGRNLLLALLGAAAFFVLFGKLRKFLIPAAEQTRLGLPFSRRLANVLFSVGRALGAGLVFIFVLYLFGDWVLLILAILLLIGALWTSKHALPRFWTQVTLLLNVGGVREGERVIFNGLPWKVETLNFYSLLVNPQLQSGRLRIPVSDLTDLRSRPTAPDENWFPTNVGDWLLLNDKSPAQVLRQTPEQVELLLPGGARRSIPAGEFVASAPTVLSNGFRVQTVFGIGYEHQAQALEIVAALERGLRAKFAARGLGAELKHVGVEFKQAAASSLDYEVEADFSGSLAAEHDRLQHMLQELCVELCNENAWTIPFPQLQVHLPSKGS